MPWLPMYATTEDFEEIRHFLNSEDAVAYLVSYGPKQWVAVNEIESWPSSRVALWHIPSGPLPLLADEPGGEAKEIADPWSAWTERRTGADPTTPYFGPGHPGVIWLNIRKGSSNIGLSSFEWIGNHYRIIGAPAKPETEKWWRRLGRRMRRNAIRIPRRGPVDGSKAEIWAHPAALAAIREGVERDPNP